MVHNSNLHNGYSDQQSQSVGKFAKKTTFSKKKIIKKIKVEFALFAIVWLLKNDQSFNITCSWMYKYV